MLADAPNYTDPVVRRVFHEIDNALERMDLTKWILAQYKTFDVDVPATRDARK